jgi:hypothetical protein
MTLRHVLRTKLEDLVPPADNRALKFPIRSKIPQNTVSLSELFEASKTTSSRALAEMLLASPELKFLTQGEPPEK